MKDALKVAYILFIGLLVAIFIYPFFHEAGHYIAALLTGLKIYDFNLFPFPYVVCDNAEIEGIKGAVIGISGMLLPFFAAFLFNSKKFSMWLFSFFLSGISALAFVLSYLAVLCYESKIIWKNEDIVKIIELSKISSSFWLVIMLSLFGLATAFIYFNYPLKRIKEFFEI